MGQDQLHWKDIKELPTENDWSSNRSVEKAVINQVRTPTIIDFFDFVVRCVHCFTTLGVYEHQIQKAGIQRYIVCPSCRCKMYNTGSNFWQTRKRNG